MSLSVRLCTTIVATLVIALLLIDESESSPTIHRGFLTLNRTVEKLEKPKITPCVSIYDPVCNHGMCRNRQCVCDKGWITWKDGQTCSYEQKTKLEAFLVSFLVGVLGVDWFVLAKGKAGYIVAGVFKLLTFGGLGVWWLVDWIRVLADSFHDGNGAPLQTWWKLTVHWAASIASTIQFLNNNSNT